MAVGGYDVGYSEASQRASAQMPMAPRESASLLAVLNTIGEANNSLAETAEWAERLAEQLTGPGPRAAGGDKQGAEPGSLVGALSDRADALLTPTIRIRDALTRIERSIGH